MRSSACRGSARRSSAPAPAPATRRWASISSRRSEPFVWRRSLDFGVIEEVRQISARIRDHFAQGARLGPGYDLKRGRGGIREVEFFVQIQQMIHGGRDAACGAGDARRDRRRSAAGAAGRRFRTRSRTPTGCCGPSSTGCRWSTTPRPTCSRANSDALDNVARLHGLADGDELLRLIEPHVERAGSLFDGLAPETSGRCRTTPTSWRGTGGARFRDPDSGRAARRRLALGQGALAAVARRAGGVRGDAAGLLQAIAVRRRPRPCAQPLGDIVERLSSGVNLFRLLEARPPLARLLAKILAHAPALADQLARRPELFEGLFDASSFALPPDRGQVSPGRFSAMRCAASPTTSRSIAPAAGQRAPLRARRPADRPPPRPARGRRRLCAGRRRRARRARRCGGREFERAHGRSRAASW